MSTIYNTDQLLMTRSLYQVAFVQSMIPGRVELQLMELWAMASINITTVEKVSME